MIRLQEYGGLKEFFDSMWACGVGVFVFKDSKLRYHNLASNMTMVDMPLAGAGKTKYFWKGDDELTNSVARAMLSSIGSVTEY